MNFKRQRVDDNGINLTPLIDVVFLLLIFFMVSTTFTKESRLQLELPSAEGEAAVEQPEQIEIVINAAGQYVVNQQRLLSDDVGGLMATLTEVSAGNTELPLIISADAATPHQAVITAMDAAGRLGFAKLKITTQQPDAGGQP
ncbi:biopolymer transporter ExbD [Spongiibacter sp. KMU-158]|uniref:Biopolymer transporter ExbD n=1 Tax=Spongiibacter pelagi TaxID=2760804 RepID=A0A927C2Z6_9GAMM|nr:biopolymer transporter ExbD [Spongiibacter pelagi]MBD2859072.1 biopolymer transporter ExbD [Spongiibacter pelagi]